MTNRTYCKNSSLVAAQVVLVALGLIIAFGLADSIQKNKQPPAAIECVK